MTVHEKQWFTSVVRLNAVLVIGGAAGLILYSIIVLIFVRELDATMASTACIIVLPGLIVITYRAFWQQSRPCSQTLTVLYAVVGACASAWVLYDIGTMAAWLIAKDAYSREEILFSIQQLLIEGGPPLYVAWSSYPQLRWTQKLRGTLAKS